MSSALVIIDMLNTYDFEDADALAQSAGKVVPNVAKLLDRATDEDVPVIYVNDNLGGWRSDRRELIDTVMGGRYPEIAEPLLPTDDDLFVLKLRHSIFYETPFEYLIGQKEIDRLVLIGQVTEQCVLYSALDAYVRHLHVVVPRDAVAHIHEDLAESALRMMQRNMHAEVV